MHAYSGGTCQSHRLVARLLYARLPSSVRPPSPSNFRAHCTHWEDVANHLLSFPAFLTLYLQARRGDIVSREYGVGGGLGLSHVVVVGKRRLRVKLVVLPVWDFCEILRQYGCRRGIGL